MTRNESLTTVCFDMKKDHNWSDELFIKTLSFCNVPRQAIADYFDECVKSGELIPIEKMEKETVDKMRAQVMGFTGLTKEQRLQVGKCIAFLNQAQQ